jgi:hypothetical protein
VIANIWHVANIWHQRAAGVTCIPKVCWSYVSLDPSPTSQELQSTILPPKWRWIARLPIIISELKKLEMIHFRGGERKLFRWGCGS